jgi:hypothetical protein
VIGRTDPYSVGKESGGGKAFGLPAPALPLGELRGTETPRTIV